MLLPGVLWGKLQGVWPAARQRGDERLAHLARLVETRQDTSLELTRVYLDRLERYNPTLNCVVTLTTERALKQARAAEVLGLAATYQEATRFYTRRPALEA